MAPRQVRMRMTVSKKKSPTLGAPRRRHNESPWETRHHATKWRKSSKEGLLSRRSMHRNPSIKTTHPPKPHLPLQHRHPLSKTSPSAPPRHTPPTTIGKTAKLWTWTQHPTTQFVSRPKPPPDPATLATEIATAPQPARHSTSTLAPEPAASAKCLTQISSTSPA